MTVVCKKNDNQNQPTSDIIYKLLFRKLIKWRLCKKENNEIGNIYKMYRHIDTNKPN